MSDGPAPPEGEWRCYEKKHATWAVKLPVDVWIETREGTVHAEGGDYLCIDSKGGLYPCESETFEMMYEEVSFDDE